MVLSGSDLVSCGVCICSRQRQWHRPSQARSQVEASDERCFVDAVRAQGGPGWEMVVDLENTKLRVIDISVAHVGGGDR
jgi:hypothetical protein